MVTSPELIYFASRRITATNSYAQTTTIFCLVAWPLGWGHGEWLLASGGVLLAREGSSELSEGSLVVAHANSEGLEVVELVGETHGTAVEEHEVTGVVGHLVHLESTLAEHGLLELEEKVLAETHGPAGTHGVGDTGVLVDEAVDLVDGVVNLNVLGSEDSGDLGGTSTDTLGLDSLDVGETRDGGQEISEGGEVLALALDDVLLELVAGSDGVGLEGEVVISGVLNTLGDLHEHGTLLASEVATGTVGHTASLSLTNHDGAGDSLLHILAHGLGLLTDELTVELASGLVAADHTGEHLEAGLDLAGVGGDDVTEGVEASVEGSLGGADGSGGLLAVGRDGGSVGLVLVGSLKLDVGKLGVETLGGLGKVTGSLNTVRSGTATDLGELAHEELVEGVDLLGSGALVLVEESTELATGADGRGVTEVGELGDAGELSVGATVHTELDGTVAGNLTGHDGDLTRETSLLVLDGSDSAGNAGGKGLASIGHLLGGLGAGSGDVLHGLGETGVSEGGLLGDTVVDVLHGAGEGGVGGSTLLGHVAVELTELVGCTVAGGRDLGGQGVHVGLHGGIDILGLLGEGIGVGGDLVVGLLDLLGGLHLEGKEGTVHGRHGIGKLTLGGLLVAGNGTGKRGTAGGVLAGSLALLSVGVGESDLGDLDGSGEVLLSLSSGGTDSVEELTAHLTAGLSRGETEVLDLGGGVLGELGHLRGDTHVEGCLGLLVHVLELHLSLHHADLTLVHGTGDGSLKLHLVGLHDSGELGAALGVAHSVGTDDTSELVHLTLELLVVLHDVTVESGHTLGEIVLGGTEFVLDVETSVTGLGGELAVDLHLSLLALGDGSVELTGLLGEHVGGVGTVLLHGGTDLVELGGVVVSHSLEASISRGLVGVDEVLKLGVLLKVLLVTLVTDLDHAVGLGTHVGVDLGLLELVLGDNTGELGDASVGLGDLLLHGGAEEVDLGLELGTSGGDTGLGLGLGSGDVLHGLSEVGVVECLGGVEGRSHTGSRRLERHIGVVTVSSHLGTDATEVSGGLGHHDLQLVVGPLASGLVLCGELGRELGAALGGLGPSVGNLLVKLVA